MNQAALERRLGWGSGAQVRMLVTVIVPGVGRERLAVVKAGSSAPRLPAATA